jgi:hypothetical protein
LIPTFFAEGGKFTRVFSRMFGCADGSAYLSDTEVWQISIVGCFLIDSYFGGQVRRGRGGGEVIDNGARS